ncbi:MAG: MBL fold metallo-hydrolase [Leucobacter sp.]
MSAVELLPDVWIVGTADAASPAFTDPYDCVQYLIARNGTGVLIDTGTGRGIDRTLANIEQVLPLDALAGALVTHCHADHGGGAAGLLAAGVAVLASERTARALEQADESLTQLGIARSAGVYPSDYSMEPAPGIMAIGSGHVVEFSGRTITALEGPGHCDGHMCFVLDADGSRSLFSGDTVFSGGRIAMQAIRDCRLDDYASTVIALDGLGIARLFPGHGAPVLAQAGRDIGAAAASFRALVPPPNFLSSPGFE